MCSRYSLTSPPEAVRSYFRAPTPHAFPPRYNIAPTQPTLIVRHSSTAVREMTLVRWGLIPSWVKDAARLSTLINARAETAAEKPSFRGPLRHRRCLVPTDGFYEWTGPTRARAPYLIRLRQGKEGSTLFAMAGLYDHWIGADGSELETMAVLTTAANTTVGAIHDRRPVVIQPSDFDRWLDVSSGSAVSVMDLLRPAPDTLLEMIPVNPKLNNARHEGPDLLETSVASLGTKLI